MKKLLWFAAAAGVVVAAASIIRSVQRKQLQRAPLQLAGGIPYEIFEAEIIEIVPLDPPGPSETDRTTLDLLDDLAREGLSTKSSV